MTLIFFCSSLSCFLCVHVCITVPLTNVGQTPPNIQMCLFAVSSKGFWAGHTHINLNQDETSLISFDFLTGCLASFKWILGSQSAHLHSCQPLWLPLPVATASTSPWIAPQQAFALFPCCRSFLSCLCQTFWMQCEDTAPSKMFARSLQPPKILNCESKTTTHLPV